ncbi:cupin [Ancylobacter lacus]|uniref:cupin n=1 Tax=Ancylobacter lacus TaxID=2579970 RepID=UPI001BD1226B|nr:cupin [Ancylobacter lacus]MBS7538060.1 cupin [Ancylobacter lacus]
MPEPDTRRFASSRGVPNNPYLPVLLYCGVLLGAASTFESLLDANGWEPRWRNGVYDYHHFHSTAHETLGFVRGAASIKLGGEDGEVFEVGPGDILVLPAGTGHKRLSASDDLLVVGAYPPGQHYEVERAADDDAGLEAALARIAAVPLPETDPLTGWDGALLRLWRR